MKHVTIIVTALLIGATATYAVAATPTWQHVATNITSGRLETAVVEIDEILAAARARDDARDWTRALVERRTLRTVLGAPESAARQLKAEPWPADPPSLAVLELHWAHALTTYFQVNAHEIRRREVIVAADSLDLKAWGPERFGREIDLALHRAWLGRRLWGDEPLDAWSEYLTPNSYPASIRGTLRDAVTYARIERLADSSLWSPRASTATEKLDIESLLTLARPTDAELSAVLADTATHPLRKIVLLCADLRAWHLRHGRKGAAFEADLEQLRRVHQAMRDAGNRVRVRQQLETWLLDFDTEDSWWSLGQWHLARFLQQEREPDRLIRARLAASRGACRHPESVGGQLCAALMATIEAPHFDLLAMSADAPERRTIAIVHRNVERLHFRAWRWDLASHWAKGQTQPSAGEVEELVRGGAPALAWTVDLPHTEDFTDHRTWTGLPYCAPGAYLIVASTAPEFEAALVEQRAVTVIVSDLVATTISLSEMVEIVVRDGRSGRPVAGAAVTLRDRQDQRSADFVERLRTGAGGRVIHTVASGRSQSALIEQGDHLALLENISAQQDGTDAPQVSCFLYTDRAVYRPGQTIHWKLVACESNAERTVLATAPGREMAVSLHDANLQVRESATVTTNDFGSASGSFTLPASGLLGVWCIRTDHGGSATVRVEEYRRPTFEVTLLDPPTPLRLGHTATVIGRADYYFGAAVSEGRAVWRVRRRISQWTGWSRMHFGGGAVVASDTTAIGPGGRFEITFSTATAPADEQDLPQLVTYHVEVEVIDAGGETRATARSFNVATVSVLAAIEGGRGFLTAGEVDTLRILRTDANRIGQAGQGRWALHALEQPERAPMPGDIPLTHFTGLEALFATPGDSLQPRWDAVPSSRNPASGWPLGDELASGWLVHDDDGEAILPLVVPAPGAYRLVYYTEDADGRTSRATRELLVAGDLPADIRTPLVVVAAADELHVGEVARFFVHSGLPDAAILVQVIVGGELLRSEFLTAGGGVVEVPVTAAAHRGLVVEAGLVRDYQVVRGNAQVRVPWREKQLEVAFETFRDQLQPGETERVTVTVTGPDGAPAVSELLAWMVDRSLDAIVRHQVVDPFYLCTGTWRPHQIDSSQGSRGTVWRQGPPSERPGLPVFTADRLRMFPGTRLEYSIDHRGRLLISGVDPELAATLAAQGIELLPAIDVVAARYMVEVKGAVSGRGLGSPRFERYAIDSVEDALSREAGIIMHAGQLYVRGGRSGDIQTSIDSILDAVSTREDFAETAFFLPHIALDDEGRAPFEFRVPEAVTAWRLQVAAHTRDLMAGRAERDVRTVKELLVRPYLPRFLREGDEAELRVVITSAGEEALAGTVQLRLEDPFTGEDRSADFDLRDTRQPFAVIAGGTSAVSFPVRTPAGVGEVAVRAVATAGNLSDGERRVLPILPGRTHLVQSRFAALQDSARRELRFPEILATDPTRGDEQLVVTVDTQLLTGVLRALPYLVDYPYQSTEQTLNAYLGVSILAGVYGDHPWVAARAAQLAGRDTPREPWYAPDPNRGLRLEETPWLQPSRGAPTELPLVDLLNPEVVERQRLDHLGRLREHQTKSGGFPWFAGGEPSLWMTLYVLMGLARGSEFGLEIPDDIVRNAWLWVRANTALPGADGAVELDPPMLTMLNYALSCYDDETVDLGGFTTDHRDAMLALSWRHRLALPRLLQAHLALTLERAGRHDDARTTVAALLDIAQEDPDLGVFWAPEDRAWLWTNDTVEGHAFILRAVSEIAPEEPRLAGLVQWLLLNRQLAHWKSTRATAEVIYALVHYQQTAGTLAVREEVRVQVGAQDLLWVHDPAELSQGRDRLVLVGEEIDHGAMRTIAVSKQTPGLAFASATWHLSSEQPVVAADGDLFVITRRYFRRHHDGEQWVLTPLAEGEAVSVGEQIEVQLSLTARHAAEFVHLRDPRPAGWEPESNTSSHRWDLGLRYYQETRDSGANFFFAWLPAGQYTLKHRLRAATAGVFRAQPAVLQSMYAPEFAAHSAGEVVRVVR